MCRRYMATIHSFSLLGCLLQRQEGRDCLNSVPAEEYTPTSSSSTAAPASTCQAVLTHIAEAFDVLSALDLPISSNNMPSGLNSRSSLRWIIGKCDRHLLAVLARVCRRLCRASGSLGHNSDRELPPAMLASMAKQLVWCCADTDKSASTGGLEEQLIDIDDSEDDEEDLLIEVKEDDANSTADSGGVKDASGNGTPATPRTSTANGPLTRTDLVAMCCSVLEDAALHRPELLLRPLQVSKAGASTSAVDALFRVLLRHTSTAALTCDSCVVDASVLHTCYRIVRMLFRPSGVVPIAALKTPTGGSLSVVSALLHRYAGALAAVCSEEAHGILQQIVTRHGVVLRRLDANWWHVPLPSIDKRHCELPLTKQPQPNDPVYGPWAAVSASHQAHFGSLARLPERAVSLYDTAPPRSGPRVGGLVGSGMLDTLMMAATHPLGLLHLVGLRQAVHVLACACIDIAAVGCM